MDTISDLDEAPVEQSGWARLGHLLVQLSIGAGTAIALMDDDLTGAEKGLAAALATALLAWHGLMAYRWHYWSLPRTQYVASVAVAAALWVPLLVLHTGFGITVLGAYAVVACPFLARAAWSVAGLSAVFLAVSAIDGTVTVREVAGVVLTGLALIVVHGLVGRIQRQNQAQRRLIDDLRATRAELAAREREAGVQAERERLARDIHDSLAQGFTSIVMLLEAADAHLDADAVDVRAGIDQARQTARDHLAEARRVVWSLRPGPLEHGALAGALEILVDTTFAATGTQAEFRVDGEPAPLDPAQEVVVYRAAQETLANAARHAKATSVVCTLTYLGDETILDVNDDGAGFDPDAVTQTPESGLGLVGLADRVAAADGELHIATTPGKGTTITVTVPTANADAARVAEIERAP